MVFANIITTLTKQVVFILFILFVVVLSGCGYRQVVTVQTPNDEVKEGIIIVGTHKRTALLWLTSGISASVDQDGATETPWGKEFYIPLSPGNHDYEIWNHWLSQRAGIAKGCFELKPKQILYVAYQPPNWMFQEGRIVITDRTSGQLSNGKELTMNCARSTTKRRIDPEKWQS